MNNKKKTIDLSFGSYISNTNRLLSNKYHKYIKK